jgi:hypothetical protein
VAPEKSRPQGGLLARVARVAFMTGIAGALIGAAEGAALGCLVIGTNSNSSTVWLLAANGGLSFGLAGTILGALVGAVAAVMPGGRKQPTPQAGEGPAGLAGR